MRLPRLLPLVAVAAGGVLAINAVENGPGIVGAARSFAEGVAAKTASKDPSSPLPPDSSADPDANAGQVVAAKPAPVCAESAAELAKEAGLSPAELQVIQSLGARRGELDAREQGLSTELAVIQAAEAKVDARIATMNALKADMQGLVGQLDDKQQAEVARLVKVYETMKPQAAAARFTLLSDEVRLPIASAMKERSLSAIIANMPPPDAKALTEALAAKYVAQANAAREAINPSNAKLTAAQPPAPAAQAASASSPAAGPTPLAEAATTVQPSAAAARKPKAVRARVHRKPHKPHPAKTVAGAEPQWPLPAGAGKPKTSTSGAAVAKASGPSHGAAPAKAANASSAPAASAKSG